MIDRQFIELLAIIWMTGFSLILGLIWAVAFLNGGKIVVSINQYGELWPEFLLWILITIIITVGLTSYLERIARIN